MIMTTTFSHRLLPLVVSCVVAMLLASPSPARAQTVIVMVNGEPVTEYDIEQRTKLNFLTTHKQSPRNEVVSELIDEKVKIKEGKKWGVDPSFTDIEQAYGQMAGRMRITGDVGKVRLEHALAGQPAEEWITALTFASGTIGPSYNMATGGMGQTTYYTCGAELIFGLRALLPVCAGVVVPRTGIGVQGSSHRGRAVGHGQYPNAVAGSAGQRAHGCERGRGASRRGLLGDDENLAQCRHADRHSGNCDRQDRLQPHIAL